MNCNERESHERNQAEKTQLPFPTSIQTTLSKDSDVEDYEADKLDLTSTLYGVLCGVCVLELTCRKMNEKEPRISAFHCLLEGMSLTKCKHLHWKYLHLS